MDVVVETRHPSQLPLHSGNVAGAAAVHLFGGLYGQRCLDSLAHCRTCSRIRADNLAVVGARTHTLRYGLIRITFQRRNGTYIRYERLQFVAVQGYRWHSTVSHEGGGMLQYFH